MSEMPLKSKKSKVSLSKKTIKKSKPEKHPNTIFRNGYLSKKLADLLEASISESSKKALKSDLALFFEWLNARDISTHLPVSPETVAEYIASLSDVKAVSTICRYMSSIGKIHTLGNFHNPTKSDIVKSAILGLRKTRGMAQKKANALRGETLIKILESLSKKEWPSRRNRAIFAVGWAGALRSAEICALNVDDVHILDDGIIITIRRSKTDQIGIGHQVGIPNSLLSSIIIDWVTAVKALYGTDNGPLFPRLGYAQLERWFPQRGVRARLSKRGLSKLIKREFVKNGVTGSTHSLRRGMITEASAVGVPEAIIQRHSRHRSVSSLRNYIESGNIMTDNPLPLIFSRLFDRS